jgi:hypothetical protein
MELLCAFLTAFFWWLLTFRMARKRRARLRAEAGPLLFEVNTCRRHIRLSRLVGWGWVAFLAAGFLVLGMMVYRLNMNLARSGILPSLVDMMSYYLVFDFMVLMWSLLILTVLTFPCYPHIAIEVRQHAVIRLNGGLRYWSEIGQFRWFALKTVLEAISLCWKLWPRNRSRLVLSERVIGEDQKATVTAALAQFAAVYDHDGTLLASPSQAEVTARALQPFEKRPRFRFQFDLQALLLFAVVVSCAASCYAIHDRRIRPHRNAIAQLAAFQPDVFSLGEIPIMIDFSKSPTKPTDVDLANLECLDQLTSLTLTDSPVTDAGLEHLKKLLNLRSIMLIDTKVTRQGAEQLSRDLPQATIFYGPRKKPVGLNVPDRI